MTHPAPSGGSTGPAAPPPGQAPALEISGLAKSYGSTRALKGVSLSVRSGTVHALVGGNGSGKSTLIKILAGVVSADEGTLAAGDGEPRPAAAQTPARAAEMGLRFVHQQNATFPDLSVAENLAIGSGFETGFAGRVRWSAQHRHAQEVLERFQVPTSPKTELGRLGSAVQMMVAIARALQDQEDSREGILVLDEPTASLPQHEVDLLLDVLRQYADQGQTIVYVSHRLEEVRRLADAATVLRDGEVAATLEEANPDPKRLVTAIMGRELETVDKKIAGSTSAARAGQPILELRSGTASVGNGPDLVVHPGECVAIAGLLGSGRTSLLQRIFGVRPRPDEELLIGGDVLEPEQPYAAMTAGLAYVPEDRVGDASFLDLSLAENLSIVELTSHRRAFWRISRRAERARAQTLIESFGVVASSERQPLGSLSGGNQQKIILARWMQRNPRVLLLDEPTQGVDVGARAEIHQLVRDAAADGLAVVVASSDFEELVALCDRALVVHESRVVDEVGPEELTEHKLTATVYAKEGIE